MSTPGEPTSPMETAFLQSLCEEPDNPALRLVYADWLEEQGDPRSELVRLTHTLTQTIDLPDRPVLEARLRAVVAAGVKPIGPAWTNSVGIRLTWVPPGTFQMGSPTDQPERQDDELLHPVTLTRGFYMSVHPVTQAQWQAVMGGNPSRFKGDDRPVEGVSWEDCQAFCRALSRRDGLDDGGALPYRLPTEAEWEYACRAGTTSATFFGDTLAPSQANYHDQESPTRKGRDETTPVGHYPRNAWGLADLHGNVFEWCSDWYGPYPVDAVRDPAGKDHGEVRVLRGGSWHSLVRRCRSASRGWGPPGYRGSDVGCRICFRLDHDFRL
ncbi:MAG: SUMF1/EgtB/PvdO family nonheme iron enzyme [Gemmataceae bacterium]